MITYGPSEGKKLQIETMIFSSDPVNVLLPYQSLLLNYPLSRNVHVPILRLMRLYEV